jgi:hypothetical protein
MRAGAGVGKKATTPALTKMQIHVDGTLISNKPRSNQSSIWVFNEHFVVIPCKGRGYSPST